VVDALQGISDLQADRWPSLGPIQKLEVAQQIEDAHAAATGRPPAAIVLDTNLDPNIRGEFRSGLDANFQPVGKPALVLNPSRLSSNVSGPEFTNTVIHEGRHGYQYFAVTDPGVHYDPAQVNAWRTNLSPGGYRDVPTFGFWPYRWQPVEADAHRFG